MIELLKLFPFISLIVTHPLEQLSVIDYYLPETPVIFIDNNSYSYIAPDNGVVKNVLENNGLYEITLLLDNGNEVVYSGLTIIFKNTGERISKNDYIGIDSTIFPDTKFILMFYEKSELFPQFVNRSLTFHVNVGTPVYMVADGVLVAHDYHASYKTSGIYTQREDDKIITHSYVPNVAGLFSQIKMSETYTYINYLHLMSGKLHVNEFAFQGERVGLSGNSGVSNSPRLVLNFQDNELGSDIRIIYFSGTLK